MKKIWILPLIFMAIFISSCEEENDPDGPSGNENVISEDIVTAMTLTADKTWIISGDISVHADLVIEPGTVVTFENGASMSIGWNEFGSLKAVGTADKPIVFTSAASNPSAGDFEGLQFYEYNSESVSELKFCVIEYAGNEYYPALTIDKTSIKMSYCTVTKAKENGIEVFNGGSFGLFSFNDVNNCGKHPIEIESAAVHAIEANNTFQATPGFGINVLSGYVRGNVSWAKQTVPYIIDEFISVEGDGSSAALTIAAGSVLKFGPDGYIEVGYIDQGQLIANGTASDPVIFTSKASSPAAGDWQGILFYSNTMNGSILNNCQVSYAGSELYFTAAIAIEDNGSNVTITNCTISDSETDGIYIYNSSPTLSNNVFTNITGQDVSVQQ